VIRRLNPELRAWCTPKDRPGFELRIPKGTKDAFLANIAKVQDWDPGPTLVRYRVRRGDVIGKIAKMHHTTIREILETNKIRNPRMIRPGLVLIIRPGRPGRHGRHVRTG
jgi:membrane-bound lytic murein transglycosylase D